MKFVGKVTAFKTKDDLADPCNEEDTILDVTCGYRDGSIEVSFTDRDETVYLRFRLSDLVASLLAVQGDEE